MTDMVMLDLETLDTEPTAVVLSIGAVRFDEKGLGREFYAVLNLDEQRSRRRTESDTAWAWWQRQSPEAQAVLTAPQTPVPVALHDFTRFFQGAQTIWGYGANFDAPMLRSLYHSFGLGAPWSYRDELCHRTLLHLYGRITKTKSGRSRVAHHALDDARHQAERAVAVLQYLALPA